MRRKSLPKIDEDLYELERQLKKALNQKRNEKKRQFLDSVYHNRQSLKHLGDLILRIEREILDVDEGTTGLVTCYSYADMERETDVDQKVSNDLKQHKIALRGLRDKFDSLSKGIDSLEKSVEQHTPTRESEQNEDAIVQLWQTLLSESRKVSAKIEEQVGKAAKQSDQLDTLGQVLAELKDKFKVKDAKYRECLASKQAKSDNLDVVKHNLKKIEKMLIQSGEALNNIIPPLDDKRFKHDLKESQRALALNRDKAGLMQQRVADLEAKLENICRDLGKLGSVRILARDLQSILDDLS